MANYFSVFLVIMTLLTGLIWLIDSIYFAPKRKLDPSAQLPGLVDNAQQFFPIFALVMVFRSFIYEPFQIPSGSMMPTLLVGDFILVEKFSYGIKDPVWRKTLIDTGEPERGDTVVFKFPDEEGNNNVDFIKRVVGLPGEKISYRNKQIFIKPICLEGKTCLPEQEVKLSDNQASEFEQNRAKLIKSNELLGDKTHEILRHPYLGASDSSFYSQPGTKANEWIVPPDSYFVLGDNRDNSRDSRFWGFVPEANLVGKAVFIWISFEFDRTTDSFLPSWVPTGIRFSRVGGFH